MELINKVAVITGASSSIDAAVARNFNNAGMGVMGTIEDIDLG